jgi:hypothetical protein
MRPRSTVTSHAPAGRAATTAHLETPTMTARPLDTRAAGALMIAATIVSIAFILLDRGASGTGARAVLESLAAIAPWRRLVHIVEGACVLAFAFGTASLALRLDVRRPAVLFGGLAALGGAMAMLGAAVSDGFITSDIAVRYLMPNHEAQAGLELVRFAGIAVQDLATMSWVLQSVGVMALSAALVADGGFHRRIGVIGFVTALPVIAIVTLAPFIDPPMIVAILGAQMGWNLASAWLLLRREPEAGLAAPRGVLQPAT